MKKDEQLPPDKIKIEQTEGEEEEMFKKPGHVGMNKKRSDDDTLSTTSSSSGQFEGRLARRHTLPQHQQQDRLSRRRSSLGDASLPSTSATEQRSIFDEFGEEDGLEALAFFTSTGSRGSMGLGRELSMSPFSRIRNDLEHFVEESDKELEESFFLQQHREVVPGSPLIQQHGMESSNSVVWVGGLQRDLAEGTLRSAFSPFGSILGIRMLDGYAFVKYAHKSQATAAINTMDGQILGGSTIRTGPGSQDQENSAIGGDTIWIGAIPSNCDDQMLGQLLSASFQGVQSWRMVPGKRCAFVHFNSAEQAAAALNQELKIGGLSLRLGYAKQSSVSSNKPATDSGQLKEPSFLSSRTQQRRTSTGSVGLPNPSRIDMRLPGDVDFDEDQPHANQSCTPTSLESLRNIFSNIDANGNKTTADAKPRSMLQKPAHQQLQEGNYCWPIPELPNPPYFGPDLTPGRIRDYRRHVEGQTCKPSEFDLIAMEILPVAVAAASDPVGNVLVQKLIERGSDELRSMVIAELAPYLAAVGVHKNGTWVVQKLINWCTLPEQQEQVGELLRPYLVALLQDQYGNYVVQCCLQFDPARNQFIIDGLAAQSLLIASSRFGARAMRSCLESPHTCPRQQRLVAASLLKCAEKLLVDANGVIVMQWLVDSDVLPDRYEQLQPAVREIFPTLVGLRFASNILTRLLTQSVEPVLRDENIRRLIEAPEAPGSLLQTFLKETNCIPIINKVLGCTSPTLRQSFIDALSIALSSLLKHQHTVNTHSHLAKLQTELLRDSSKTLDLSHMLSQTSSSSSSDSASTPSPQPVIMSSKLKAHVDGSAEQQIVFGTSHQLQPRRGNNHIN